MKYSILLSFLLSSCGTKPYRSSQVVFFDTKPQGCEVCVYGNNRELIFKGVTPCQSPLPRQMGAYSPANYSVDFKKKDYYSKEITLTSQMEDSDLWVISTITVVPAILRLISQPATRSLYCLPERVAVTLYHK